MESDRLIWLIEYGWWLYAWWPMNVKRTQNGKREKWKLLATPIDQICKQRVSQKQGESEKKIIGTNEKWPKDRHGQDIKLCHSLHVHRQNQAAKYGDFQSSYKSKVNSCIVCSLCSSSSDRPFFFSFPFWQDVIDSYGKIATNDWSEVKNEGVEKKTR